MSMLKEISNENVVTSILHKALNLSGENKTVPTTPSSPPLDLPTSSCQSPSSATPSEGNLENTSTSQRTMSGMHHLLASAFAHHLSTQPVFCHVRHS